MRRSSPCPALPSVSHTSQGVRGEGTLWLRGFMAETTVCTLSCWPEPPREQFNTHPCGPQMGFPAGAQRPTPWPESEMAPVPICADTTGPGCSQEPSMSPRERPHGRGPAPRRGRSGLQPDEQEVGPFMFPSLGPRSSVQAPLSPPRSF